MSNSNSAPDVKRIMY